MPALHLLDQFFPLGLSSLFTQALKHDAVLNEALQMDILKTMDAAAAVTTSDGALNGVTSVSRNGAEHEDDNDDVDDDVRREIAGRWSGVRQR